MRSYKTLLFLYLFLSYPPSSQDGPANPHWGYTMSWGPSGIGKLLSQIFHFRPLNFTGGAKNPNFSPKFRPHSSSDRRSFDLRHSIGNLKQSCQGPMVDIPPHQIWCRSVPPTLRSDGANGTSKVHKLKICHLLAVTAAHGKQSTAGCAPAVVCLLYTSDAADE